MGRVSQIQRIDSLRGSLVAGVVAACMVFALSGCSTYATRDVTEDSVSLARSPAEIPETELLDVRIEVFDPGTLPESEELALGLSEEIRQAEAHFTAVHLKTTLQRSGYWGAVRVVPAGTMGAEVTVSGKIVESDGELLALDVSARDARGVQWFEKSFEWVTDDNNYKRAAKNQDEVFQSLYNEIANEIAIHRAKLSPRELKSIRQTAELRFASELAPSVFSGYLAHSGSANGAATAADQGAARFFTTGQAAGGEPSAYRVKRLPATDDPMIARVRRIRSRDYLLVDTLDEQYEGVYREMRAPYTAWRETRLNEINSIREVDRQANEEVAKGLATIVLGVLVGVSINNSSSSNSNVGSSVGGTLAGVATSIGMQTLASASRIREEAGLNLAALTESGESFEASVAPYITEVEGETVQLTGTAAGKYAQWRGALKKIHDNEMGLASSATGTTAN